jgi:hypothetical protein
LIPALLVWLLLGSVSPAGPGDTPEAATAAEEATLDPVVATVVRMLEAGVEPAVIASWLKRSGAEPGMPGPEDLIALTRAGAPSELIRRLIDLASGPDRDGKRRGTDRPRPPGAPASPPAPPAASTDPVPVEFDVEYVPETADDDETPFDLFVYVDGRPLGRCRGGTSRFAAHPDRLVVGESLPPGRHVVRLLRERHEVRSRRKGTWSHEARVFPDPVVLDLDPGAEWKVRLRVTESRTRPRGGTVDHVVMRGRARVDEGSRPGPGRNEWPGLCEELELGLKEKEATSRSDRRALEGCLRWGSLWEDVPAVPDRRTIRDALQANGFEPVPRAVK